MCENQKYASTVVHFTDYTLLEYKTIYRNDKSTQLQQVYKAIQRDYTKKQVQQLIQCLIGKTDKKNNITMLTQKVKLLSGCKII